MFRYHALRGVSVVALQLALSAPANIAMAQDGERALPPVTVDAPPTPAKRAVRKPGNEVAAVQRRTQRTAAAPERQMPVVVITTEGGANASLGTPPIKQRFQLPQQSFSITAKQIDETINLKDPEDAVKYMPSLFVRKRNDGDNQAVLATRSWGLNSSARTLIYFDDLLISALIGNNNSGASPQWNLVSPESIARIDFLNGPFAAAYPGNSIGGVLLITSKMPDKPFAIAKETVSVMPWNQYGTRDTYVSSQTSAAAGNRNGALSWLLSANYQDSYQQPLTYTTNATIPAGTTGTFPALNKQGLPANVVGTGALAHSQQTSANLKLAYDVTPLVQAGYSLGIWNNVQTSNPQTYLTSTATGAPTFGGIAGFASNKYIWDQTHLSNAVSLRSDTKGVFDFDLSASSYNYLQDIMLNPFTVASSGVGFSQNGKITRNDGTNWQNADAKGIWRPFGFDGPHEISFGVHGDRYRLENPVFASSVWNATSSTGTGQLYSDGIGETRTGALWVQDAWKIASESEADARRTAGNLAGAGRLQHQHNGQCRRRHHLDRGDQSTRAQLDQFFAKGVVVLRSEQGLEHHREFRRGLSLSDRDRTLPERLGRRRRDLRQSVSDAGAGSQRRVEHRTQMERWPCPADAVQGEDQQRHHLANQPRDESRNRRTGSDHDDRQRRRDPDAGRRTVGREEQCADHRPAAVRQRDLCRFRVSSPIRPGRGPIH